MQENYFDFGEQFDEIAPACLILVISRSSFYAVEANKHFTFVEARKSEGPLGYSEVLVVDCKCDQIHQRSPVGLEYPERFGLRFFENPEIQPEVRALRRNFPLTAHQNSVPQGEPASLCLYSMPWTSERRSWTPQKHLKRILWWLKKTEEGKLHHSDQPVEQLFFNPTNEIVLPPDFNEKIINPSYYFTIERIVHRENGQFTIIGKMDNNKPNSKHRLACIVLVLPNVVHGRIEPIPYTLKELDDSLVSRNIQFFEIFITKFQSTYKEFKDRNQSTDDTNILLILYIPISRYIGGKEEKIEIKAFAIQNSLDEIGLIIKACFLFENTIFYDHLKQSKCDKSNLSDIRLDPMEVQFGFSTELARRVSGIEEEGPKLVLAGAGALGGNILNFWRRSGWGQCTVIDPDHIKPHNLARHIANGSCVGMHKVRALQILDQILWNGDEDPIDAIAENASNFTSSRLFAAFKSAHLIVDATTTLGFPRDYSSRNDFPRGISVFLTPTGNASVLLAESVDRVIRLDSLEAQYYRFVIESAWGTDHLERKTRELVTGASCRDLSVVLSYELISIHAANLARQIRNCSKIPDAAIKVWDYFEDSGELTLHKFSPFETLEQDLKTYIVIWDTGLKHKVRKLRESALPHETGGVVVGYFDQLLKKVFVVDVLAAPPDSKGDKAGFTRGTEGLHQRIQQIEAMTQQIVTYVGEWHSHPGGSSTMPSKNDISQLVYLGEGMHTDGLPGLMLIVGEEDERWILVEVNNDGNE